MEKGTPRTDGPVFRVAPAPSKGSRRSQRVHPLGVGGRAEAIGDFGRDAVRGHFHSAHKAMEGSAKSRAFGGRLGEVCHAVNITICCTKEQTARSDEREKEKDER